MEEMRRQVLIWVFMIGFSCYITLHVHGDLSSSMGQLPRRYSHGDLIRKMEEFKTPSSSLQQGRSSPLVYYATRYGADPTGKEDSTEALLRALSDAFHGPSQGFLMEGIGNLGGAEIHLEGGNFMISQPLRMPAAGVGNLVIHGGTLRASDNFPEDGYLIELSSSSPSSATNKQVKERQRNSSMEEANLSSSSSYNYEYITLTNLMLDSNYRGGGISVINSLRTTIDNCYITHFSSDGILVQGGHETYISNSFIGQHITAGGDSGERNFSGTGISLLGNDNAVTDVVIFSANVGIMVGGQANILNGVHCYNKAAGFGGTGIYLRLPGLTQTRIVNSYLDYTGIVAEDPVQLHISNSFFLGDASITLKSVKGVVNGVNIVDNMFTGFNKGVEIVQLDQRNGVFKNIDQVVVDRNSARGMNMRSTIARASVEGNGTLWTVDFSSVLLFPDLVRHTQYSLSSAGHTFPNHVLRNVTGNRVVIESDVAAPATLFVTVDQTN